MLSTRFKDSASPPNKMLFRSQSTAPLARIADLPASFKEVWKR